MSTGNDAIETEKRTVVLLPGMDGTGLMSAPLIEQFPEYWIPVVVSYPYSEPLDYASLQTLAHVYIPKAGPDCLLQSSPTLCLCAIRALLKC